MTEENKFESYKPLIFIFAIGILLACIFILGSWYSCHAGDGTLTGLKCIGYKEIGVCQFEGKKYKVPEIDNNYLEGLINAS